jgi:hypothetical protein
MLGFQFQTRVRSHLFKVMAHRRFGTNGWSFDDWAALPVSTLNWRSLKHFTRDGKRCEPWPNWFGSVAFPAREQITSPNLRRHKQTDRTTGCSSCKHSMCKATVAAICEIEAYLAPPMRPTTNARPSVRRSFGDSFLSDGFGASTFRRDFSWAVVGPPPTGNELPVAV